MSVGGGLWRRRCGRMTRGGRGGHRRRRRWRRELGGDNRRAEERQHDNRVDVTTAHGYLPAATDVTGSEKWTRPVASS